VLERHFGCPVVHGQARNAIVFRASDAKLPFITRNAELLDMLAPQLERDLKQQTGGEDSFLDLVRGAIQQRLTGHRPTAGDVARELHMSSRTLQRRLQEAGSSFQRVLDESRHRMARYYLRNSVLELNEAAYLLGYEDASPCLSRLGGRSSESLAGCAPRRCHPINHWATSPHNL
jgi:AraC-like DNA-binding protein